MKKYLMMGIAALALASCSKDDITYINPDVQKYETAFVDRFGQPSPDHTWGFGSDTRAFTRGAAPNANEWAQTWLVPDPLTAGQKERVTRYFQSHPNLTYQDPGWSNYFMQQVYKGGGTDRNNSQWCTSEKDEWYTSANNGSVVGSDHMDHLIAKSSTGATDHIYNFNNGTCSTNPDVLDNGYTVNEWSNHHHSDEIQLMTNSYTYTFTYGSSDASMVRERRCALVSAEEIDRWATQEAGGIGETVNDDWHRSFMGFDFEQRVSDEIFAKDENSADGFRYATVGDGPMAKNYYWDGEQVLPLTDEVKSTLLGVRMLINESNMYCGINGDIDQNNLYSKHDRKFIQDGQERTQEEDCLDLTLVYQRISDGYYPIEGSNLTKWVKPEGGADGYYSDWIVTLSEAQPIDEPDDPDDPDDPEEDAYDFRVMAEDLTITASGAKSDFDFNDVVFDVKYVSSTKALVKVRAAGGIYPIRIAGRDDKEIHALLGGGMTMTNTYPGKHYQHDAEPFEVDGTFGSSSADAQFKLGVKAITVEVNKGGGWTTLDAPTGKVASKIGVPVNVDWCDEFQDIDKKWGANAFENWVRSESAPFWKGVQ